MRFRLPVLLAALLLLLPGMALSQQDWAREYGGSRRDVLNAMISVPGGGVLAAGSTESTDGDLSMRTRESRAGWLLRLDGEGNTVWSCVTAHVGRDTMIHPYAHSDGTFSAILHGTDKGSEWLRVSSGGKVLSRMDVPQPQQACLHGQAVSCWGMPVEKGAEPVLAVVTTHEDGTSCCAQMTQDGAILPGGAAFSSDINGLIRPACDGSGRIVSVAPVYGKVRVQWITPGAAEAPVSIDVEPENGRYQLTTDVLPLEDGSVIFSGQLYAVGDVIIRVSEAGGRLFLIDLHGNAAPLTTTQDGFACFVGDEIRYYDESGVQLGVKQLDDLPEDVWVDGMAQCGEGVALLMSRIDAGDVYMEKLSGYAPVSDDEYGSAVFARSLAALEGAQTDGDGFLLTLRGLDGQLGGVHVAPNGSATDCDAPPLEAFELPCGNLSWTQDKLGARISLERGGRTIWQTVTPIHTAADRLQWLCAAQAKDGSILLGGRYLTQIVPNTEEKEMLLKITDDGVTQSAVVARLGPDGVLRGMETVRDMGCVCAILPGEGDGDTLLLAVVSALTSGKASNLLALDGSFAGALDFTMELEPVFLLAGTDGGIYAAGTSLRHGRKTAILQRVR